MKVEGAIADQRAITVWKESLLTASSKKIHDFVAVTPSLQTGFRLGKIPFNVAVKRVQAMLDQTGEMPLNLRQLLSGIGLNSQLLAVLSEEAILAAENNLRDFFGGDFLYASMLLSDRKSIRLQGISGFEQGNFTQPSREEKEAAGLALNKLFHPFLEILGASAVSDTSVKAQNGGKVRNNEANLDQVHSLVKSELADKSREVRRQVKELAQIKSALEKSQTTITALEAKLRAAVDSLVAEQTAHQTLSKSFEQEVADEAQRRVEARVLPWLEPAEKLAVSVEKSDSKSILERAEDLLSRQKKTDRRYGLWSELAQEREDCLTMIDRLNTAMQESIRPLSQLGPATESLSVRARELETILGLDVATSKPAVVYQKFSNLVKAATTIDQLAALRFDLEASYRLGFLQEESLSAAYKLVEGACWHLYSTRPENALGKKGTKWQEILPLYALQLSIRQGDECLMLIDGHNALFRLRAMMQLKFEGATPGSEARRQFYECVSKLTKRFPNLDTHIWYDGGDARDFTVTDNLVVHYSGGYGRDRADSQIVTYLHSINYMQARPKSRLKILVTADRDLCEKARSQGAGIMAPEELAILISSPY